MRFIFVLDIKNHVQGVTVYIKTVLNEENNVIKQSNKQELELTENVQGNIACIL